MIPEETGVRRENGEESGKFVGGLYGYIRELSTWPDIASELPLCFVFSIVVLARRNLCFTEWGEGLGCVCVKEKRQEK